MKEKNEMWLIAFITMCAIALATFNMVSIEKLEEQVKALQEELGIIN